MGMEGPTATRFPPSEEAILIPAVRADGSLEPVGKIEAHRTGQLHLAVSVFVFDAAGRLLVQRRAASKYHCPGTWANTCCTHPHWGEGLVEAAHRRTREELGFALPLAERRTIDYRAEVGGGLVEHERVTMFTAHAEPGALAIRPAPEEVDKVAWHTPAELRRMAGEGEIALAPWFAIYLERFPSLAI